MPPPLVQVSRDSQVTWPSRDYARMAMLLGNPGILGQEGYMDVHPVIIPGWPGYLEIPGYLDKGGHTAVHPGIIPG